MNAPLEQLAEIDQKNREIAADLTAARATRITPGIKFACLMNFGI